jgi:hypothetical protein
MRIVLPQTAATMLIEYLVRAYLCYLLPCFVGSRPADYIINKKEGNGRKKATIGRIVLDVVKK